jgi:hypothetical protein
MCRITIVHTICYHISFARLFKRLAIEPFDISYNRRFDLKVKGSVYVALSLSILLYGSEIWCLREDLFNRLRHFHHRCARIICRNTIAQTIRHRISSASLFERLSIEPSTHIIIINFFDGQAMSPECH